MACATCSTRACASERRRRCSVPVIDPAPELILHGGRVYTVDEAFSTAEALAIKGGRLVGVGSDAEIRALAGRTTRQLDLANRTVLPGFIDGHNHMVGFGLFALALSLEGAPACSDVCERIAARAAVMPPGQWIICGPIGTQPYCLDAPGCLAEGRFPARRELDAAAPEHPVYVWYSVGK